MTADMVQRRTRITPEREAELYAAVLDLLRDVGYDALTMDAVATRTRSSKATLYRQWGNKAELVVKALRHQKPVKLAEIDTGSLRGDFYEMVSREDDCRMQEDSALMRGLVHVIHENSELHTAFRELMIEPEITGMSQLLERAVRRGEVRADNPALPYVVHMMVGAFVGRDLVEAKPLDRHFLRSYLDAVVLPALGV